MNDLPSLYCVVGFTRREHERRKKGFECRHLPLLAMPPPTSGTVLPCIPAVYRSIILQVSQQFSHTILL